MRIAMLDHLNMTVRSVRETSDWYGRVFGFEVVEEGPYAGCPWCILRGGRGDAPLGPGAIGSIRFF